MPTTLISGETTLTVITSSGPSQSVTTDSGLAIYDITLTASSVAIYPTTTATTGTPAQIALILRQDSTGGRSITLPSNVVGLDGGVPTVSTLPGYVSMLMLTSSNQGVSWVSTLGPGSGAFTQAQADARYVRTVNGVGPDNFGNVAVTASAVYGAQIGDVDMQSLKGLTIDPRLCNSTRAMVAGVLWCAKARVTPGVTISNLMYNCAAGPAGLPNCYIAVFSTSGVLLSTTGNISASNPFATGSHGITIPAFTTPTNITSVIVALLAGSGATMPILVCSAGVTTGLTWGQDGTQGYPFFAYGSGLTAMPSNLVLNASNCVIAAPGLSAPLIGLN